MIQTFYLAVGFAVWYQLMLTILALQHPCRDDQYWFDIYGKCEPCSRICDPPNFHEKDCPELCPRYTTPTTTTTLITSSELPLYVYVIIGVVSFLIIHVFIGCLCYKKRTSLKKLWPLRFFFNKFVPRTTVKNLAQPTAEPEDQIVAKPEVNDAQGEMEPLTGSANDPDDLNAEEVSTTLNTNDEHVTFVNEQAENRDTTNG